MLPSIFVRLGQVSEWASLDAMKQRRTSQYFGIFRNSVDSPYRFSTAPTISQESQHPISKYRVDREVSPEQYNLEIRYLKH